MRRIVGGVLAAGLATALLGACSTGTAGSGAAKPAPTTSRAAQPVHRVAAAELPRPATHVARPKPKPEPKPEPRNFCAKNTAAQKVIVSIAKQHAWMCARRKDVFDTPVTTGMVGQWTKTPTGNYVVQGRNMNTVLTLNTGAQYNVKYWIPFDAPLFGFHDSSWQHFPYGSPKYKTDGSHGCIHMPLKAMRFLYNWTARATDVHIA
ncbi:MAG TPA: L,D-transpeptidase [Jatrophihabitantaceae bacterium]|jgi:lipoprotein-anchoring transpeptidase ErfK/SrfK|nr:L,D-transpeptidase [Jatrophihabitantaceae bacterium]